VFFQKYEPENAKRISLIWSFSDHRWNRKPIIPRHKSTAKFPLDGIIFFSGIGSLLNKINWDNPFKRKGLSIKQKFQYAHIGFVYLFAGFVMPLFYVIPIILDDGFTSVANILLHITYSAPANHEFTKQSGIAIP
jgi:hypothetical protein